MVTFVDFYRFRKFAASDLQHNALWEITQLSAMNSETDKTVPPPLYYTSCKENDFGINKWLDRSHDQRNWGIKVSFLGVGGPKNFPTHVT